MCDNFDYTLEQNRAVAGLPNIWKPKLGEIEEIITKLKIAKQQAENARQQEENARQQEIVQQQIVARQRELEQQNPYYQAPPPYFMTTPNGTIHYYY